MCKYTKSMVLVLIAVFLCSLATIGNAQSGEIIGGIQRYSTGLLTNASDNSSDDSDYSSSSYLPEFQLPVWLKKSFSAAAAFSVLRDLEKPTGPYEPEIKILPSNVIRQGEGEIFLTREMKAAVDAFAELIIIDPKRVMVQEVVMPGYTDEEWRMLSSMDIDGNGVTDEYDIAIVNYAMDQTIRGEEDINGDGIVDMADIELKAKLDLNCDGVLNLDDKTLVEALKAKSVAQITLKANRAGYLETTITVNTLDLVTRFIPSFKESILEAKKLAGLVNGISVTGVEYWIPEVIGNNEDRDGDNNMDIDEGSLAAASGSEWMPYGQFDIDADGRMDLNEDVNGNGILDSALIVKTIGLRTKMGSLINLVLREKSDGTFDQADMRLEATNGKVIYFDESSRPVRITEKCNEITDIIGSSSLNSYMTVEDLKSELLRATGVDDKLKSYLSQLFEAVSSEGLNAAEYKDKLLAVSVEHHYQFASVDYILSEDGSVYLTHVVYNDGSGIEITYFGEFKNYEMMAYHPGHYGLAYQIKRKNVNYNSEGKPISSILLEVAYDKNGELLRNRVKSESFSYNSNGNLVFRSLIDRVNGIIRNKLTETIYYRNGVKYMKFLDIVNRDIEGNITDSLLSREEYTETGNISYNKTVSTWDDGMNSSTSTSETRNRYTWDGRLTYSFSTNQYIVLNGDYSYTSNSAEEQFISYHRSDPSLKTYEYRSYENTDNNNNSWRTATSTNYTYDADLDLIAANTSQVENASGSEIFTERIETIEYRREIVDNIKVLSGVKSANESWNINKVTGERNKNWSNRTNVQYGYHDGVRTDRATTNEIDYYDYLGNTVQSYKSDETVMYDTRNDKIISGNRQEYVKYGNDGVYVLQSSLNFDRMFQDNGNLLFSFSSQAYFDMDGDVAWMNDSEQWYNEAGKIVSNNSRYHSQGNMPYMETSETMAYYSDNKTLMQWTSQSYNTDGSRASFSQFNYDQNENLTNYHKETTRGSFRNFYDIYDKGTILPLETGNDQAVLLDRYYARRGEVKKTEDCEYLYNEDGTVKSATYAGIQVTTSSWWSGRPWERPEMWASIDWTMNTHQEYETIIVDGVAQTKVSHVETHKRGRENDGYPYYIEKLPIDLYLYGGENLEFDPLAGYPVIQDPSTIKPGDPQSYSPFWLQYEDGAARKGDYVILDKYFPSEKQRDDHPSLPTYASYEYDLKVDIERDADTGKLKKVNIDYTGYNESGEKEYVLKGEYFYNEDGELENMNEVTEGEMPAYYPWYDVINYNDQKAVLDGDEKALQTEQTTFDETAAERLKLSENSNATAKSEDQIVNDVNTDKVMLGDDKTISRKTEVIRRNQFKNVIAMKQAWDVKSKKEASTQLIDPALMNSQTKNK
ncbi:MAG: hypothetical protein HQL30_01915 [Candidatus Omnitrophica bacterium]|nr:hypothetical protein [Candidatus Omnitrophota bacterium]